MHRRPVFALNHITAPSLRLADLLRLAGGLGIGMVELRNDLPGVEIADGTAAAAVRRETEAAGVRILSINALQRFNDWCPAREEEAVTLARYAHRCGVAALVLCPVNSTEDRRDERRRAADLRRALKALVPILSDHELVGLVEPLGFWESSLRLKRTAVDAIDEIGGSPVLALVHDTFHHFLAGEAETFPERTGLVHVSGVEDASLQRDAMRDAHRVLVGPADRMDNVGQIRALRDGGYHGPLSFEPFAATVHELDDPAAALRASIAFIGGERSATA